ncbi:DNA primase [Filimonas zeae]|uniref:DNA primase n=1 Tax=Filimonas zeae TaxID=1737353 RepID=A0A917MTG1_9BACT|nr:DNA primase [Filimonas zeae]MDR6338248.1 DNA primase [Filimonas zeae]GGH62468.1 hypothetical protein GCM10011379_12440 [Filimonas zeae]
MITPQTIQQITSRIDILDVVGEFVKLKKRGTSYLGLCPFHGEKSPSFTVSPAKEIYKCFGCGKSGNSITFLMEHEKYSYIEAMRWLAARYNIEIEETAVSPQVKQAQLVADSLFVINNFARNYFTDQLWNSEEGQNIALSYLEERGFAKEVMEKFQLGYSPQSRTAFITQARTQQFTPELLLKTGLVVNRNDELLDNYRGRIIFPIHNNTGKIIGFGARVIGKAEKAPKYINTPENELYVKSKILYGSYFARQSIDKNDECLLVEGYTDVISLHQAGIENVVASGGTSLTIDQLRLIKKYTNNLTIIYDGDAAGIKAALRGLDMALEEGLDVKLVLIPDKEDPDSYVRKVGAAEFREFVKAYKKDFILFQLEVMLKDAGNDVSKRSAVVNHVAETLSKINKAEDFTKQQEYIRQCSGILRVDETGFTTLVNKYKRDRLAKEEKKQGNNSGSGNQSGFSGKSSGGRNSGFGGQSSGFNAPPSDFGGGHSGPPPAFDNHPPQWDDGGFDDHMMPPMDFDNGFPPDDFGGGGSGMGGGAGVSGGEDMDTHLLVNQDEAHEKNIIKVLLEFGLRPWGEEGTKTIAQHIFEELEEFHFETPRLEKVFTEYYNQYTQGLEPTTKTLLYHEDEEIRNTVINITFFAFEISQRWDEKLVQVKSVVNQDNSEADVNTSLHFFKVRKIKKMFEQNQRDMERVNHSSQSDEYIRLIKIHLHLKELEKELSKKPGTVIFK